MTTISLRQDMQLVPGQLIVLPSYFGADEVVAFEAATNELFMSWVPFLVLDAREVHHIEPVALLAILDAADRAYSCGVELLITTNGETGPSLQPPLTHPSPALSAAHDLLRLAA